MNKSIAKMIGVSFIRGVTLLVAVVIVTFLLADASPIDPISAYVGSESAISQEQREAIAKYWGLDQPPAGRLVSWLKALAQGDMGKSYYFQQPVTAVIGERFTQSIMLMGVAWVLSGVFGFLLGVIAAAFRHKPIDKGIKALCLLLSSSPSFWLGLLMMMVFAVKLGWFPLGLAAPIGKLTHEVTVWERLHHLILPAVTLSITGVSSIALHTRQKLIDILESDFMLFSQARGEGKWQAIRRHGLRNILLPAVTLQFAAISELFGGSVLAENVFSYTGLGQAAVLAGTHGDTPLLMGIALFSALFVFCGNMIANLLYPVIDPQIREAAHGE
ncbi:ABC transporter permease [Desulfosporosinus youngiae]|uniref:ABC-type dipeptide/oligopeptide/nickel transport system, permease component n=1 Tax=Desulfosporosinus youngiae DSM 17734 TaxID=768710 RepID=H5Y661_9FIRM|nr:ABC transporter permease [Desulfosporosinus youngiae]EHQ91071.1 ABC-type dipeptide/oligopeptide/nickel transport system, permease component [Desulfosporosinus youngiae DSM 17734]